MLVVGVIRPVPSRGSFLESLAGGEIGLESPQTLCLGGLVATVLVPDHWPLLALLRAARGVEQTTLLRQLKAQADTDSKTGLRNAEAWRTQARRLLTLARLIRLPPLCDLDLDYFKDVNDRRPPDRRRDYHAVAEVITRSGR
ncbi:GGDEF domain-containing protein [Pseudonocardia sp. MCCB 268]|nr:GGDEF domain-containing protein [Pseudonocardia cytotoxica]